jgi:hypothetical protein
MVAKINRGNSLYGAIIYNQEKVNDATARIISGHRMITDVTGNPDKIVQQTMPYAQTQSHGRCLQRRVRPYGYIINISLARD